MTAFLFAAAILVHDWYEFECCAGLDCKPVASCSEIKQLSNGRMEWGGFVFSGKMIHPSRDGQCHVCVHYYGPYGSPPRPHCIYILQES